MQPDKREFQPTAIVAGALRCMSVLLIVRAIHSVPFVFEWSIWTSWLATAGHAILATCLFVYALPIASLVNGLKSPTRLLPAADNLWTKFVGACAGLYIVWRYFAPALVRYVSESHSGYIMSESGDMYSQGVDATDVAKLIADAVLIAYIVLGRDYVSKRMPKIEFVGGPEPDVKTDLNRPR